MAELHVRGERVPTGTRRIHAPRPASPDARRLLSRLPTTPRTPVRALHTVPSPRPTRTTHYSYSSTSATGTRAQACPVHAPRVVSGGRLLVTAVECKVEQ